MTIPTPGDKTLAFKLALYAAARDTMRPLALPDHPLLVRKGQPTMGERTRFDDIVAVTGVEDVADPKTLSASLRSENHDMTATVLISVWRAGTNSEHDDDPKRDLETVAMTQAYTLLRGLEEYVRVTDKTLGGLVWWCRTLSHESDGEADPKSLGKGRVYEIAARFGAATRISGSRAAVQ